MLEKYLVHLVVNLQNLQSNISGQKNIFNYVWNEISTVHMPMYCPDNLVWYFELQKQI